MILLCQCAKADVLKGVTPELVLRWLEASSLAPTVVNVEDLCGACARRDPALSSLSGAESVTVVACHGRAVRWLLRFAGLDLPAERLKVLNMREQSAEEIIAALSADLGTIPESSSFEQSPVSMSVSAPDPALAFSRNDSAAQNVPGARRADQPAAGPEWIPWFPVIDSERCTDCRQCLGFCLFGVYAADAQGHVRVVNPSRCKTNCPACARTCPQLAIMFPKYPEGPISGREVRPEDMERGDLRVKPARQRADIQAALRARAGR